MKMPLCGWIETGPSVLANGVFGGAENLPTISREICRRPFLSAVDIGRNQHPVSDSSLISISGLAPPHHSKKRRNEFCREEDTSEKAEVQAVMPWRGDVSYGAPVNNRPMIIFSHHWI